MTIVQWFEDIIGIPVKYDFLFYIFGLIVGVIILDAVIRFILSGISNIGGM